MRRTSPASSPAAGSQRATERLHALADASRAFAESVGDYQALLQRVARVSAETLRAACCIRLLSDDGQWLDLAVTGHFDPAAQAAMQAALAPWRIPIDADTPVALAVRRGESHLVPVIDRAALQATLPPERQHILEESTHSMLVVPLRLHGRSIGSLMLARTASEPMAFDGDDLALVQDLADRAALAIGNAQLLVRLQAELAEREQAQQVLHSSWQTLEAVIEGTDSIIWAVDSAYRLVVSNQAVQRIGRAMYGRSPVLGDMMLPEIIPEERRRELQQYYDRALAGERFTVTMRTPIDSVLRTVEYRYNPMLSATGAITGVCVFGRDITDRLQAERTLHDLERKLGALFDLLPVGVYIIDDQGAIAYTNPVAQHLLGDDFMGVYRGEPPANRYLRPDGTPRQWEEFAGIRALREQQAVIDVETGIEEGSGAVTWIAASAAPVEIADWRVVGVVQDITYRKQVEQDLHDRAEALSRANAELSRALQLKAEFLAMMSHELRTPLNAVLGFSDLLVDGTYGPLTDAQAAALSTVTQSGRHLLGILSDILYLTQIEAGGVTLERSLVDVTLLGQLALQVVHGPAAQKQIRLMLSIAFGVTALQADERRLMQVLTNLLDNAVKFTPEGGVVSLEVIGDPAAEQIRFSVRDTGIGIAAADMERLFKPFTQVDGRLSRVYGGIGLGLTLVRRLTELHGGSVRLESTPGHGSCFTVTLPWRPDENLQPQTRVPMPAAPRWPTPPHVLVVDDDARTVAFFTDALTSQGYRVTAVHSGAEALLHIGRGHVDAVILDIQMQEIDGLTVLRRARDDPATASLPIVAVTALAMPGDRERCLEAGATRYLTKPLSARTLNTVLVEVLGGDRGAQQA